MGTVIVSAAVLTMVCFAIRSLIRDKKAGKCSGACPGCGGSCGSCSRISSDD